MIKRIVTLLFWIFTLSCGQNKNKTEKPVTVPAERYNTFDKNNHLRPIINKTTFDTLHGWDLGWTLLEPINIAKGEQDEIKLATQFSAGQKALYFFWYMDAEVTNGGFIQFYWNENRKYVPPIIDGLKLIQDTSMLELVKLADKEYQINESRFILQKQKDNWEPLYEEIKKFDELDSMYFSTHKKTMELIEKYVRLNPEAFVKFK